MLEVSKKWLEYAKADLEAAEVLLFSAKTHHSYQLCVLHCHQALEKILKTVIIEMNVQPKRTHDLVQLAVDSSLVLSKDTHEYINKLSPHYQPSRYPDISYKNAFFKYNKRMALYHFKRTKEIFLWIEAKLKEKSKG